MIRLAICFDPRLFFDILIAIGLILFGSMFWWGMKQYMKDKHDK